MRFLFLIHGDREAEAAMTTDERRAIVGEHIAYGAMLRERGAYVLGEALNGEAVVVQPDERPLVTDGRSPGALPGREWRRLCDRSRLLPSGRAWNSRRSRPRTISSPEYTARSPMILPPFTNVPLREPRSRTQQASPNRSNKACTRETPVGVHDHIVRLERSDGHSLGVQRPKLAPASAHAST